MIANTYDGGLKAAGAVCPNDAMDNDKGVPKEQFKDRSNHGESANKISESHSEPPTRRSTPPPSPLSARLGDAAGGKIEVPPDGRDKKAKKFKKSSAQHDVDPTYMFMHRVWHTRQVVSNISESRPETPSRRSDLPLPPSGALLGAAAGVKGGLPPTGDGQAVKENKKVSAQHDGSALWE